MSAETLQRRVRERELRIECAREYADLLLELEPVAVVVVGSVARGDFNRWSDLDVLVVVEPLPSRPIERLARLRHGEIVGVQPIGWTPEELTARRRRGDPIAREADTVGVVVAGQLPSD